MILAISSALLVAAVAALVVTVRSNLYAIGAALGQQWFGPRGSGR